ncbi:MAG TPA: hypothetical protein VN937_07640 [Blastocatellia bacterium]|nr:hypothetical protein [Blastocatellia bacterium]
MNDSRSTEPVAVLIELLRSSLTPSGAQSFGHLVLYTSFGVVRGRTGLAFTQEAKKNDDAETGWPGAVIALNEVTVEHYSNHLASATFDRLYVKLSDVQGFALVGNQGQG